MIDLPEIRTILINGPRGVGKKTLIFIIGLTCDATKLPESIRKIDFFQHQMNLDVPTRLNIIEEFTMKLGLMTSGYVARDLKRLVRLAILHSLREPMQLVDNSYKIINDDEKDFEDLFKKLSLHDKFETMIPYRLWSEIGGYKNIKLRLKQIIEWPINHSDTFDRLGIKPTSGLLLYGPSVQALVCESRMNTIYVKGPSIYSKYFGETENVIRNLFKTARKISPCIIFFDEMDSIAAKRDSTGVNERVLSTLLNEMDGIQELKDVLVIGCTNRPDRIDDAILRPESALTALRENIEITQISMRHIQAVLDKMRKTKF
ncbi:11885_t:CDS:2 [Diversispora eburnea]|uniref:11885_t:CDS:1 n=1 Tax=Diversispora eburnea TaxID=1213867 RepID=A0A9N8W8T4_9GLOM|nr:11885_t:CDS:2 [Diversispora eburnea]